MPMSKPAMPGWRASNRRPTFGPPDAVAAYQEGLAERMRMAAEDGRKLVEDTGKIVKSIADLLPNGCSTNVGGADLKQAGARS